MGIVGIGGGTIGCTGVTGTLGAGGAPPISEIPGGGVVGSIVGQGGVENYNK
ncbi:unnamed protein product [marine sediment metagenome]|uniref:Uncharacterized protein n=1 Tax=marine sediment metagenome TaxID=412755 RepID=X1VMA5_9ZZZZ